MPLALKIILSIIASYLVGSIPTAYLFGRLKGIDIRQHGSGNVGATNAFRVLGRGVGTIVLLLDILKGVIATALIADIFGLTSIFYRVVLGLVVVAGHNWTISNNKINNFRYGLTRQAFSNQGDSSGKKIHSQNKDVSK